jgi:hypothetical protein
LKCIWVIKRERQKKPETVGLIPKSNIKIVERDKNGAPNTQLHYRSFALLGTDTLLKSGGVKLVLWTQISPLSELMRHASAFHM